MPAVSSLIAFSVCFMFFLPSQSFPQAVQPFYNKFTEKTEILDIVKVLTITPKNNDKPLLLNEHLTDYQTGKKLWTFVSSSYDNRSKNTSPTKKC